MFGQGFNYGFLGKPLCFTDTTDIFKDNSGVALYTLDYDGSDSGNATGKFSEAAVFNGTNSYIDLGNNSSNNSSTISASLWFKTSASGSCCYTLINNGGANSSEVGFNLRLNANGTLRFGTNNGSSALDVNGSVDYTDGNWHHVVLTYDNGTYNIYVDGDTNPVISGTDGTFTGTATRPFWIGRFSYNALAIDHFNGSIDQVRIFNKEISSSEVTTLYNETKNTTNTLQVLGDTSCIATYTFDGSSTDLSGNYSGTDTNILYKYDGTPTNVDFGVGGKSLYGARFNGSSSYINLNSAVLPASVFSVSFWVNVNSLVNEWVFSQYTGGVTGRFIFNITSTGGFQINVSSTNSLSTTNIPAITIGNWHHVVVVKDGSNGWTLYSDGSSHSTWNSSENIITNQNTILGGDDSVTSNNLDGKLDQVRIFNKALSSSEVSKLYGNGAGEIACKYTATTTDNYFPLADGSSDVVAYIPFDNSAEDLISGDFGTLGSGTEFRFGRFGQAVVGNQNTWSADFPNISETANSPFSVSCWVNIADRNSTIYFFLWSSGFGSSSAWGGLLSGQSGKYYTNFGNQVLVSSASVVPPLNQWFHYVLTYDGTNVKVYSDTEKVIDGNINTGALASNNLKVLYNGSSSEAKIDQVRIYDAALSSNQVTQLYNEKPEVDTSNFKAVLYEGTGANEYISNVGFEPDLVWLKCRNVAKDHRIYDSVRGATKFLEANNTDAEATASTSLTSFDSNGFTLGAASTTNSNNDTFIGWCWKGGGAAVPNTDGTITSQVSANTAAGFSIIKTAGGNSSAGTVGHGLNSAPEMVITKGIDNSAYWWIYHSHLNGGVNPEQYGVRFSLNGDSAQYDASSGNLWNNTAPTNSVISLGGSTVANPIIYAFHSVSGYSKIGTYTGNTSSTNTINVGFAPSFLMIKRTDSSGSWRMYDRERDSGNLPQRIDHNLAANSNGAEYDATSGSTGYAWFSSTGFYFETNQTNSDINANGGTYIYMAFK